MIDSLGDSGNYLAEKWDDPRQGGVGEGHRVSAPGGRADPPRSYPSTDTIHTAYRCLARKYTS